MGNRMVRRAGQYPWRSLILAIALVATGCGTLPRNSQPFPGTEPTATVVVDNFVSGYVGMIVFLTSTTGGSERLGSVASAGGSRFSVRDIRGGEYLLEGRLAGRVSLRSSTFIFGDGDTVEWNLSDNRISYR